MNSALKILWGGVLTVVAVNEVWASGVANPADLGVVMHRGHSSKGHFAVIDQGSDTGFVIGRDVCFFGADLRKLLCAGIVRTKPRAAAIVLTAEDKDKIVVGAYAWPADLGPVTSYMVERLQKDTDHDKSDAASLAEEEEDPPEPILPPVLKSRTQFHIAPTMSLPIWMNDLRFEAGARAKGSGEIWSSGDTIRGSVVGFGLRHHMPQNGDGDAAFDVTYHFVPQNPVKDDFDLTDGSVAVQSAVWSHHYRFRWLRGATWRHRDDSDLLLYTGLGYDLMMAKFEAAKTGASKDKLVTGSISAHAVEIPLVVSYQMHFGRFMLTSGADMAIPLYMGGVKARGTLHYSENVGNADKSLGGAIDALNVRRGWFSVALQFGLGAVF
jgi:hypothetical protein